MHGQVDLTEPAAPAPVDGPGRRSAVVAGPARLALLVVALLAAFVGGAVLLPPDRAARTAALDASEQPPAAPPVAPSIQSPPAPTLSPAGTGVLRARETRRPAKSPAAHVPTKKKAASPARNAGRPSGSRAAAAAADKPAKGVTALENQVTTLVNQERAKAGCGSVATDERLRKAARGHSQDMATKNYFSHDGQDGSTPWDRAKRAGYPNPIGENIAKGQRTPADVMDGWMNSDGHRRNILNCDAKEIGVGLAYDGSSPVWTQLFGAG